MAESPSVPLQTIEVSGDSSSAVPEVLRVKLGVDEPVTEVGGGETRRSRAAETIKDHAARRQILAEEPLGESDKPISSFRLLGSNLPGPLLRTAQLTVKFCPDTRDAGK